MKNPAYLIWQVGLAGGADLSDSSHYCHYTIQHTHCSRYLGILHTYPPDLAQEPAFASKSSKRKASGTAPFFKSDTEIHKKKRVWGSYSSLLLSLSLIATFPREMEITRENFVESLPAIKESLCNADFIAIDAEFSGQR